MNLLQIAESPAIEPSTGGEHRTHGLVTGRDDGDTVLRYVPATLTPQNPRYGIDRIEIDDNYRVEVHRTLLRTGLLGLVHSAPTETELRPVFKSVDGLVHRLRPTSHVVQLVQWADVVQVERPFLVPFFDQLRPDSTPLVYSSHNDEVEYHQYLTETMLGRFVVDRIDSLQREAVNLADLVIAASERDLRRFEDYGYEVGETHVAPNATPSFPERLNEIEPANVEGIDPDEPLAIFVGSDSPPNRRAVENLLQIAPRAQEIQFGVIGGVCDRLRDADLPPNVHPVGFVEDLSRYYVGADLVVNPMTEGSGSNLKVLEALAHGCPVVSTPFGVRGIEVQPGVHVEVAELGELSVAIEEMIGHPEIQIADRGRELVKDRYLWPVISEQVFDRYERWVV